MVLLEFSMTPLGKGESVSEYVSRSLDIIDRDRKKGFELLKTLVVLDILDLHGPLFGNTAGQQQAQVIKRHRIGIHDAVRKRRVVISRKGQLPRHHHRGDVLGVQVGGADVDAHALRAGRARHDRAL